VVVCLVLGAATGGCNFDREPLADPTPGEGEGEGEGEGCGEEQCSAGTQRCAAGDVVQTCSDYDGDGCREWGGDLACPTGSACADGSCEALCTPECALGEAVCAGGGVRTCVEGEEQGCPELGDPAPCGEEERCDGGRCVPDDVGCTDACAEDGHSECTADGRGYRLCGAFDEDGCLDLSVTIPCAADETCAEGECLPDCTDECDVGTVVCQDAGVSTCGNFDRDRCLELGPPVPCRQDERCDNGRCVPAEQPCEDDCGPEGGRVCTADELGYRQCGRYDADPCLELSSSVDCGPDARCEAGVCRPTCEDDCVPGGHRCTGESTVSHCGNFDDDGCLEWGPNQDCDEEQRCDDGVCVQGGDPCEDGCPEEGVTLCSAEGDLLTCANVDADPCLEWGPPEGCGDGARCQDGRCVPDCVDECGPGEVICEGNGTRQCGDFDDDPCADLSEVTPCEDGRSCVGGQCVVECADDCAEEGLRRCAPDGSGYQTCGAFDPDACRDWSSTQPCDPDERCEEGRCVAVCQDECEGGERRCVGNAYQVCGDFDDDPCSEYGGGGACEDDEACEEGACQSVCDNECVEGAARCSEDGLTRQTCGNYDGDPCREWSSPEACAPTERCEIDACAPQPPPAVVVINEVLYDGPGQDPPAVFVELWGPAGTDLRGYTLVGINGNGGALYTTVELLGLIPPDGLFVLAHPQASDELRPEADQLAAGADLENAPDAVQLRWGEQVVDALAYGRRDGLDEFGEGTPAPAVAVGQSLTRNADHDDTGDNSVDFTPSDTPTPGRASACEDDCPEEDATRCADDMIERCAPLDSGCLGWTLGDDCTLDGGHCAEGSCVSPLGCSLPTGVDPPRALAGFLVTYPSVDVMPHGEGFAIAVGDASGIRFGLLDADGVVESGPTYLGGGSYQGWGSGDFFMPTLARTDTQFAVVWAGYEAASPGNCPLHFRRLTLEGQAIPSGQDRITQAGRSAFNPAMVTRGPAGRSFLVAYNDYTVNRTVLVDPDANAGAAQLISTGDYGQFLRQSAFSSLAPAPDGFALAFSQTANNGGTRVYFKRLSEQGASQGADTLVSQTNPWSRAKSIYLFRVSEEPVQYGLFWQLTEGDVDHTAAIHYAVLGAGGQVISRVRLNDLARPDLYLPQLNLIHVLQDGDRFGVVHRRQFPELEQLHYMVQWLSADGQSQGRTDLGDHSGVLARHPDDGLYRLFINPWGGASDLRVATLSCPE